MADIQQWRRKILPRSKTPTVEQEERSFASTTTSTSSTPRRRSRPKLTSLLSYSHATSPTILSPSLASPDWLNQSTLPKIHRPDVLFMAQVIMTKLLENAHEGLTPNYNSQVMHIIEAYQNVAKEKEELAQELKNMEDKMSLLKRHAQDLAARLTCQHEKHRIEVERLQLLFAKASTASLTSPDAQPLGFGQTEPVSTSSPDDHSQVFSKSVKLHQDSTTTKPYNEAWESLQTQQHSADQATFSFKGPSDSASFTKAIQHSRESGIQTATLTFPEVNSPLPVSSVLTHFKSPRSSPLKSQMKGHASKLSLASATGKSEIVLSEDNYSTFSSNGDAFSDEVSNSSDTMNLALDKDFDAIRCLAEVMARRHGTNLDKALSKLTDVFFSNSLTELSPTFSRKPTMPHLTSQSSLIARQLASNSFLSFPPSAWPGHMTALSGTSENDRRLQGSSQTDFTRNRLHRPFSFTLGDDRNVDIFHKEREDQPKIVSTNKDDLQFANIRNVSQKPQPIENKAIPSLELSEFDNAPPMATIHKSSTGSQIPVLRSASNQHSSVGRLRENSTSSVGTIVQCSSVNPESRNSGVSRPDSVRTSSLQSIMNGLRADRSSTSAASSLRTSSTNSDKKKTSGLIRRESLLSDEGKVVAMAAARAAGGRGGSQQ